MKAALLKELRLVVHPSTYFIVVLGALVLIPSWMYGAIFIYGVLVAFFNGMNAREMHDLEYSFSLPLSRTSMTRARILTMIGIETIMLAIMVAFIALRGRWESTRSPLLLKQWEQRRISILLRSDSSRSAYSTWSSTLCIIVIR